MSLHLDAPIAPAESLILVRPKPSDAVQQALRDVLSCNLGALPEPSADDPYSRTVLVESPELSVVAVRWRAGAKSELHGHSGSAGFYHILHGQLEEQRYLPAGGRFSFESEVLKAGDESFLPAGSYHQLWAVVETVSVHVYNPNPNDATETPTHTDRELMANARRIAWQRASHPFTRSRWMRDSDIALPSVGELAQALAPRWSEYENDAYQSRSYRVPARVLADMRASRILAAPLPCRMGGLGASLAETARAVATLAEQAPAAALALVMPLGNAATCRIPLSAVPPQHVSTLRANQRWLADEVLRGRIFAVANSEPGAGGDLLQTKTLATTDAEGTVRLTGQKAFATIGPDADYFLCAARSAGSRSTEPERGTRPQVDGYFISREAPGVTVDGRWEPFGMRPTASVGLKLEAAPVDAILGYPGCLASINARHWSTLLFAAVFVGIGEAALRQARDNVGTSTWAAGRIAEHALALDAARGFLDSVCRAESWPMPKPLLEQVRQVKTFVTRTVAQIAVESAMLCGGRCYSPQHPVYRLLADALAGPLLRPPIANAMDASIESLKGR